MKNWSIQYLERNSYYACIVRAKWEGSLWILNRQDCNKVKSVAQTGSLDVYLHCSNSNEGNSPVWFVSSEMTFCCIQLFPGTPPRVGGSDDLVFLCENCVKILTSNSQLHVEETYLLGLQGSVLAALQSSEVLAWRCAKSSWSHRHPQAPNVLKTKILYKNYQIYPRDPEVFRIASFLCTTPMFSYLTLFESLSCVPTSQLRSKNRNKNRNRKYSGEALLPWI